MYFSAIGFIYDVKKGPFWEHSPILFDISGVKAGWAKINKVIALAQYPAYSNIICQGMLKMYNAEVLSKFPVVQHFPFGSIFVWERDPTAAAIAQSVHTANQPSKPVAPTARPQAPPLRDPMSEIASQSTRAPWAGAGGSPAPFAGASSRLPSRGLAPPSGPNQPMRAPWTTATPVPPSGGETTAPWAMSGGTAVPSIAPGGVPNTRAPWANKGPQTNP
jgi:serine/threonine-protein phosphatase 2A activator